MIDPPFIESDEQNKRIKKYNVIYKKIYQELEIPFLSIFERLEKDQIWQNEISTNDGVQTSEEGYELLAEFIKVWDKWRF